MNGVLRLKPLIVSIAIPLVGGYLSSKISGDMQAIYESLALPSFAPDAKWFGVVWPILYLLIGVASYLIWQLPKSTARTQALTFYAVQLFLNFLWSPVFFRLQNYRVAFWILSALLVLALVAAVCFALLDRRTIWLFLPYLVWLVYAAALNRAVEALN